MGKQSGKNPFVHPKVYSDGTRMLNTVGNDGWSYDEKDDDEYDEDGYVIDKERTMGKKSGKQPIDYEKEYGVTEEEYHEILADIDREKISKAPMGPEYAADRKAMADRYNHMSDEEREELTDEELCNLYDAEMIEKDLADDDEFE